MQEEESPPNTPHSENLQLTSSNLNSIKSNRLVSRSPSPSPMRRQPVGPNTPSINRPQDQLTRNSTPGILSPASHSLEKTQAPRSQLQLGQPSSMPSPAAGSDPEYAYTWETLTEQGIVCMSKLLFHTSLALEILEIVWIDLTKTKNTRSCRMLMSCHSFGDSKYLGLSWLTTDKANWALLHGAKHAMHSL